MGYSMAHLARVWPAGRRSVENSIERVIIQTPAGHTRARWAML